ncbi:hypothetical protein OUZ56_003978 [Daphnia magna]|uniref:Uncharacterized protein n=1 Tax=Daphnia magna TaxID=35525 RepID=A0ABQ9YND7_9CRUS|nr:hypothetical protein OUZ56_003978 [Daphnia magna]
MYHCQGVPRSLEESIVRIAPATRQALRPRIDELCIKRPSTENRRDVIRHVCGHARTSIQKKTSFDAVTMTTFDI